MMIIRPAASYTLRTEEEAKLTHILSQQRRYQQQLQQQQQHLHTHHHIQAASSPALSPRVKDSHPDESIDEGSPTEKESTVHFSQSVDSSSEQSGRRHVWANPADLSVLSQGSGDRPAKHTDDLTLQDVNNDCDARSSVSLLESESVYLPFDIPASPIVTRRPFTAPEKPQTAKTTAAPTSNITAAKPPDPHSYPPRPFTAAEPRQHPESKYDALEQRPIRPLNQNLAKGSLKPSFDVSRPPTSSSEPCVSSHKDSTLSTARSQDYESSSEQTSESEAVSVKSNKLQESADTISGPTTSPKPAPQDKLNHIKTVAGSKKASRSACSAAIKDRAAAAAKVRGTAVVMKTSSTTTTKPTASASAMAASASVLLRARLMKAASAGDDGSSKLNIPVSDTGKNVNIASTGSAESGKLGSPSAGHVAGASAGDSKQLKGKLNLERMELKKDGSSLGSVRDSGFLSRPASDAVMDETQQLDNKAATSIQAFWRGYWAREHNTKVVSVRKEIRARRAEDHIMLLRKDLERNRKLYEEEKRLRILQMEAIRLLYQEVQVLKSQSLVASKDLNNTDSHSGSTNTTASFSPMTTAASTASAAAATGYSELNRTQELERTCASLQSQVSQLQEALESVSSAVFRTNSLDSANFDLTDHSDTVQVTPCSFSPGSGTQGSDETSHWGCIPHSLSPYPSEEEEHYYLQVPTQGAPTPPRRLQLQHYSRTALVLSWQPSSCSGRDFEEEEEGNRHIIGYRVYVNDQLKAFICQRTSALVEGLNPNTTYKFYVKALSGFGESYESNIIMAKLARDSERLKYRPSSATDSSQDSEKDVDSTESNEKVRRKNRKLRKSPRSMEKKRASKVPFSHREHQEGLSELLEDATVNLNSNNSSIAKDENPFAILTHAKLHTHRKPRSRDLQVEEHRDSASETTSKEPSPCSGTGVRIPSTKPTTAPVSPLYNPVAPSSPLPASGRREVPRKLPESPKVGSKRDEGVPLPIQNLSTQSTAVSSKHSDQDVTTVDDTPDGAPASQKRESPSRKKESPPSGTSKSSSRSKRHDSGDSIKNSPHVSPSCGSEGESKAKISPKAGTSAEGQVSKTSTGNVAESHSSSMSETFTVDKASSFLESVSAITESALGGKSFGHGGSHEKAHGSPSSGSRGHRRTRSRDLQQQMEKLNLDGDGKAPVEHEGDSQASEDGGRSGSSKHREKTSASANSEEKEASRKEGDGGSDPSGKVKGHRRRRSKDLNTQMSEWKKDEAREGEGEEKKEGSRLEDAKNDDSNPKPEEDGGQSAPQEIRDIAMSSRPVIDGRRRHSSGSRPNSPVVTASGIGGEERTRMSVAEMMMEHKAKSLNKSSSLNSLSGRSEDSGSRSEISKRSPSIESLPGSTRGDNSKRTVSNESLLSGGSSRGEGSKRTQSSESLMSIRTDTSKRSHSNESLPGSARTDNSRRSPSNESLPESIREESEQDPANPADGKPASQSSSSQNPCRRSQSMGSARDAGRKLGSSGDSSQGKSGREATSSMVSKLLLKLESITRNNSTAVKEKKESLMVKKPSSEDRDSDPAGSKPPSDDERKSGRRSRNLSESDVEGAASDAGSQLPPRAPSDSSSGSHSDDNRHSRRGHRRTPSDHRPTTSLPPESDPTRPTHSPIIMEGGMIKKSSSNVRRNQSFHGLLPSKHQDAKASPSSNEDISAKPEEQQQASQAQTANTEQS